MKSFQLATFFALVRIPTVFSSMSNAFAGFYIGGGNGMPLALWAGIIAAALFIMAGMALNDLADEKVDALERPTRPIPSGAITLQLAWLLSLGMMTAGLIILYATNLFSFFSGLVLCLSIFAYNFLFKGTSFGPISMGLCRLFNLFTGISLTWNLGTCKNWILTLGNYFQTKAASLGINLGANIFEPNGPNTLPFPHPLSMHNAFAILLALISLWGYITLVTYLARDEVQGNSKRRLLVYQIGLGIWFFTWAFIAFTWYRAQTYIPMAWLSLAIFLRGPLRNLIRENTPKHTGQVVGTMLRFVPLVDVLAMLTNGVEIRTAIFGALWILPAYVIGKTFYST